MYSVLFWEFIPRGTDKIINKMKIEKIKCTTGHEHGAETNSEERGWYMSGRATLRRHTGWPGRSLSEWHLKKDLKEWRERGFWEAERSIVGGRNSSCRGEQEVSPGCLRSSKEGRMKNPRVAAVMAGRRVSSGSGMASRGTGRLLALTEVRSHGRDLGRRFGSKQPLGRNQPHCCVANGLEWGQGANSEMRPLQKSKSWEHSSRGREVVGFWIYPLNTLNHIGKTT